MSLVRGFARRPVALGVLRMLLALSAVMLLASPLLPHGPACTLKARTDCTACTLDSSGGAVNEPATPVVVALVSTTATVVPVLDAAPVTRPSAPDAGRAPPA